MIFDNNLKEENFITKPDEGITGNIKNYNNTNDMINKMLFSQVNTPTKSSFENNNGINNKNQDNILRSNSTKNFYLNSTEKKKFNFNFLEENDNNFSDNLKKNEEQNNISNNFFKFNQNNKNNYSPTTDKNEIFTPLKNPQNKTFNFSNSFRSNLSISYGLNNLSLNLVHRGLIMYQTAKKSHFRTRVSKGPPICLRWVSWLVLNNIPVKRSDSIIDYYLSKQIDKDLDKLIIKDIDRTFSNLNSNYFNEFLLKNSLYRILKAYATLDPEMGYCQGINLLTAFLLIICNYNEKDVFYILISILSNNYGDNFQIRGFFSEEFQHLKIFTFFFEEIFEKYNKKLRDHFNKIDLPIDVWAGRWFQTFFTICLPVEMCQRVWDCLFSIGPYFIFSFTLALLKEFENKLLAKNENIEIMEFFNKMQKNLATENINLSNSINNNYDNAAGKLTENAYNFNIESVIKQAQKIKFTEKYFQKLKKNYFISNNIKKDFLTEKYFLKINEGEIENFVKDSTVDFRNNIMNTMSSTNIKQNVNNLNTNMKNVNIKDLPNIINNIENNFILDFEKKNNLILDEEKNIKVEKNLNFNLTENKTTEFLQLENPEKNIFNSTNKLLNILNNNNLENKNSQNLKNENFSNTKNNNINDIRITSTSDTNIRQNFRNDLVTSLDNLKISPRFKNIDSNSNKKSINSKKDYFENAIFKTDISIENYPSNTNLNQKSIDIDKINSTNPKTCNNINDSIKNYKNKLELKKIETKKVKDFDIAEFEYNINSESGTGINKENSNINFEEYPKTEINKINNFELKNNNKNNYIVTEDSQKNTDFYRKGNTSILNKNNLDYSQYAEKNNESCSFINEKKYSVYNHVNNSKGKKENYLINTNNINKNNSILNYNLNLQNKSYVNKYNNSRFEIEEILPFNKYKNDDMEEFENNPDNEHISLPKNNQNYNMNNLRNKNSCEFPIIGGKIEKIDIKNALFRYSKNNPRYTWKQDVDQIHK